MGAHRFWRLSNLKTAGNVGMIAAEVVFYNEAGVDMSVGGSALSSKGYNDVRGDPRRAFDKNSSTDFLNDYQNMSLSESYIGYESPSAYELYRVGLLMRQGGLYGSDMWQTASVQYSDNGEDWFQYGFISPLFETDKIIRTERVVPVLPASTINIGVTNDSKNLDIYANNYFGGFSGIVTQGETGHPKLPLKAQVLLYDRMTNKIIKRTWSDDSGVYTFDGLDAGREYYAVTLHPNRTYNAAIQDGLKSGMTP